MVKVMREVLEHLEIPMEPGVCRVLRVQRTKSGRSWLIRVAVEVEGATCPMRVLVPSNGRRPGPEARVRFSGLRVEFDTIGGRCRPVVRAERVEEVTGDGVAAA